MIQPDRPRPLAFLLAQAILPTPSQSINIIEVVAGVATWQFPNQLPNIAALCVLVGGRPGTIYTTHWTITDPGGETIADKAGPDIPFTTQIKRVNAWVGLREFTQNPILAEPGIYQVRLAVNGEEVARTPLEVSRVPAPSGQPQPPQQ